MTLTFELDLETVKMDQHAKYLGQRSSSSNVIVRTHRGGGVLAQSATERRCNCGNHDWQVDSETDWDVRADQHGTRPPPRQRPRRRRRRRPIVIDGFVPSSGRPTTPQARLSRRPTDGYVHLVRTRAIFNRPTIYGSRKKNARMSTEGIEFSVVAGVVCVRLSCGLAAYIS